MKEFTEREEELWKLVNHQDDDVANKAMNELKSINDTWHFCVEFDFMPLCDKMPSWDACLCHNDNKLIPRT